MTDPHTAWNYNEPSGTTVLDRVGASSFTMTGTTTRTAAGGGYTYGGTRPNTKGLTQASNEVQLGPATVTPFNTAARTWGTWGIINPADPSWFLEAYSSTLGGGTGVSGWLNLSSTLRGRAKNTSNTAFERNTTAASVYHYWAFTQDGANLKVYRTTVAGDPTSLAQVGADVPMAFTIAPCDAVRIFDNCGSGVTLSDTRVWGSALTLAELKTWAATPVEDAPVGVSGVLTGALPGFTAAMTGNAAARGTAAGDMPGMVAALTGRAVASGGEAGVLPALVAAFTGEATAAGDMAALLPAFTGALTGAGEADGVVAGPLPGFVGSFTGAVGGTPVGVITAALPALVGSLAGHVDAGEVTDLLLSGRVEPQWHTMVETGRYITEVEA